MMACWNRWLRVVLPPSWTLVFVLCAYLAFESLYLFVRFWLGFPASDCVEFLRWRDAPMVMAVVVYGLYRVAAFHPVFNPNYYDWLRRTPWTMEKPLLVGPLSVVPQDAVVLGILRGLLHGYQMHEAVIPLAFFTAFSLATVVSCWMTSPRIISYVMTFALGIVVLLANVSLWAALTMVVVVHVVGRYGIQHSLSTFPWLQEMARLTSLKLQANSSRSRSEPRLATGDLDADCIPILFGWPTNLLHPRQNSRMLERHDHIWLSALAGWASFIVLTVPQSIDEAAFFAKFVVTVVGCGCVIGRLFAYCLNYWPPITIAGRIWTGRLIIPGYDQVLISPVCALAMYIAGCSLMHVYRTNPLYAGAIAGISVGGMLLSVLLIGPSLQHWRLTGQHRIWPGLHNRREFTEI